MKYPFQTFRGSHFMFLLLLVLLIAGSLKWYRRLSQEQQNHFQTYMAVYFLVEELLYSIWLLLNCHDHVWQELLPLQLCSFCVYIAVASVYFKKSELRFFSGIIGTLAGLSALIYPANISHLYPIFSYRTINFFLLHGAFVLFGLIQLEEQSLLQYRNVKRCSCILGGLVIVDFLVNLKFHTNYMFLGVPSTIAFIDWVYSFTGILFLPVVMISLSLIQCVAVFFFKQVYAYLHQDSEPFLG